MVLCILVESSNCGKPNGIINLIQHKNGLKLEFIYIYCKSIYQPKYNYLEKLLRPINRIEYHEIKASANTLHASEAK